MRIENVNKNISDLNEKLNNLISRISNIQIWDDIKKTMNNDNFESFKDIISDFYAFFALLPVIKVP